MEVGEEDGHGGTGTLIPTDSCVRPETLKNNSFGSPKKTKL